MIKTTQTNRQKRAVNYEDASEKLEESDTFFDAKASDNANEKPVP